MVTDMSPLPATGKSRPSRSRRSSRPSGDDRELAILTTAERLLGERPLSEISIDDLARGAGISRPTFYFYFPSKDAVLLTLVERVAAEADSISGIATIPPGEGGPATHWRHAIDAYFQTFRAHRAVTLAIAQAGATNSEVRALWSTVLSHWIQRTSEAIQFERARGAAPDGVPADELATVLNLMNERALLATYSGEPPSVSEDHVVDVLLQVWLTSIYQTTTPPAFGEEGN